MSRDSRNAGAAASPPRAANLELILIGTLIGLILKGTFDHFLKDHDLDKGLQEFLSKIPITDWFRLSVFVFTYLRFVYGAYRYHEEEGEPGLPTIFLDLIGVVILFISLYATGLAVRNAVAFFVLFSIFHVVDIIWFILAQLSTSHGRRLQHVGLAFAAIDFISLLFLGALWHNELFDGHHDAALTWIAGSGLIVIGIVDFYINRNFYFFPARWRDHDAPAQTVLPPGRGDATGAVYFAGPLFTQAEWRWNADLAGALRYAGLTVSLPQERAERMLNGVEAFSPDALFADNVAAIEGAQIIVAVLDGSDADSGTCWECGYAYYVGKPVIGVRTDIRPAGDDVERPVNLMLGRCCTGFVVVPLEVRNDVQWVANRIIELLGRGSQTPPVP